MDMKSVSIPEIYKSSFDFRFFINWFCECLEKTRYDTENLLDLYDPLRCPKDLLWMLGDTMGYKYDDRVYASFNRLVMLYFMSMIRYRGSQDGVTLAAELNLAQFVINKSVEDDKTATGLDHSIYEDRLETDSIPVNSVSVQKHTAEGYIDVVYFSDRIPTDVCLEYVRPVGMYCATQAGVQYNAKTKISVDTRLTNMTDKLSTQSSKVIPTHIGQYRRSDYASLQQGYDDASADNFPRNSVYYRNSKAEGTTTSEIDAGLRSIYSLQLCNNEQVVNALITDVRDVFSIGDYVNMTMQSGEEVYEVVSDDSYPDIESGVVGERNLMYTPDKEDENITTKTSTEGMDDYVTKDGMHHTQFVPEPKVDGIMDGIMFELNTSVDNS